MKPNHMPDHIYKLFRAHYVALNRWEIAFNDANGRMTATERHYSRIAYAAYHAWQTALDEEKTA